jgi:hypothetical protein
MTGALVFEFFFEVVLIRMTTILWHCFPFPHALSNSTPQPVKTDPRECRITQLECIRISLSAVHAADNMAKKAQAWANSAERKRARAQAAALAKQAAVQSAKVAVAAASAVENIAPIVLKAEVVVHQITELPVLVQEKDAVDHQDQPQLSLVSIVKKKKKKKKKKFPKKKPKIVPSNSTRLTESRSAPALRRDFAKAARFGVHN